MHIYIRKKTKDEIFHYIFNGDMTNLKVIGNYGYLLYKNTKNNLRAYLYSQSHNNIYIDKDDVVKILTDEKYNEIYRKMLNLEYKYDIPDILV